MLYKQKYNKYRNKIQNQIGGNQKFSINTLHAADHNAI